MNSTNRAEPADALFPGDGEMARRMRLHGVDGTPDGSGPDGSGPDGSGPDGSGPHGSGPHGSPDNSAPHSGPEDGHDAQ